MKKLISKSKHQRVSTLTFIENLNSLILQVIQTNEQVTCSKILHQKLYNQQALQRLYSTKQQATNQRNPRVNNRA